MNNSQRKYDTNGWYVVKDNPVSKVGVFPYLGSSMGISGVIPGKIYWVLRPASSLQGEEFLESIKLLPWIDEHTMLGAKYTPAEQKGVEGVTGESPYFKSGKVFINLKVFSEDLKQSIDSGKVELSLGYTARYEKQSGIYKSQRYDFVQRDLRGNHLALVDKGRMGSDVAVQDELDRLFFNDDNGDTMTKKELAEALAKQRGIGVDAAMEIVEGKDLGYDPNNMTMDGIGDMLEVKMGKAMDSYAADMKSMVQDMIEKSNPEKEEDGKGEAMDAADKATISDLAEKLANADKELESLRGIAQDQAAKAELGQKNELADRLSKAVGVFDHSEMTLAKVEAYGLEKFGLSAPAGAESAVLDAHMNAVETSGGRFATMDEKASQPAMSAVAKHLQENH